MEVSKDDLSGVLKIDAFKKSFIFISILVVRVNKYKNRFSSNIGLGC